MRTGALLIVGLAVLAAGCTDSSTKPSDTPTSRIFASPGSFSFSTLGASSSLRVSFQGSTTPPPDSFWHFASSNPAVATVSGTGPTVTVTAVGNGSATIHVTLDTVSDTADVPVTVNATAPALNAYNGTYKGDVNLQQPILLLPLHVNPESCAGSLGSYGETITINVNSSGTGTATVTDTPNFDRAYSVTIPSSLAFTSTGSFPFLGVPIPGQLQVTINSLTQLTFQETTTYGNCSNTYGGKLTKQ